MTIQELFITSNQELRKVINQITDGQWELDMPPGSSRIPMKLRATVQYHTYDDAWVPDVLDGKTAQDVGEIYEPLRDSEDVIAKYNEYNQRAIDSVQNFTDLERLVHLSYGDFPAKEYLQHIISFRAFRCYDIAQLIGVSTAMDPSFVQALLEEFSPVIEGYRQMGVFPPALPVAEDADPQTKLLAMVGRQ
jgi:uncharacterized protein (TIGR03086 family)